MSTPVYHNGLAAWRPALAGFLLAATWPVLWLSPSWLSLWPSLVALTVVFLTLRVMVGLLAGAAVGVILLSNGNPLTAFVAFFQQHLIPSVQSDWRVSVIVFTFLLGGYGGLAAGVPVWAALAAGVAVLVIIPRLMPG